MGYVIILIATLTVHVDHVGLYGGRRLNFIRFHFGQHFTDANLDRRRFGDCFRNDSIGYFGPIDVFFASFYSPELFSVLGQQN